MGGSVDFGDGNEEKVFDLAGMFYVDWTMFKYILSFTY